MWLLGKNRTRLIRALKTHPIAYSAVARLRERPDRKRRAVRPNDDLVIEGFPRSGNTFATYAFLHAQAGPVKVGNHCHAPAQLLAAARWQVPAVLLIRDPIEAILSYAVFRGGSSVDAVVDEYIWFHESVLPAVGWVVVAPFPVVIRRFGSIIAEVNARYGVRFRLFDDSEASTRAVMAEIDAFHLRHSGGPASQLQKAAPSRAKDEAKERLRSRLTGTDLAERLAHASSVYARVMAHTRADWREPAPDGGVRSGDTLAAQH